MALTPERIALVPEGYGMNDGTARHVASDGEQSPAPAITPFPTGRILL
jgi:hypothetical protein